MSRIETECIGDIWHFYRPDERQPYMGECSVPRFEGRFSYPDVPVMLSLDTEIEFVYSREERWCYNTEQHRGGKTQRVIDDTSLGNCPSCRPKKNQGISETVPVYVFKWKEEQNYLSWWTFTRSYSLSVVQ
jgi:hypothetical protein